MSAVRATQKDDAAAAVERFADAIEHFDTHDIGDELEAMPDIKFKINVPARKSYYPLERGLSDRVESIARQRGVSAETLLNLWVQEKAAELLAVGAAE